MPSKFLSLESAPSYGDIVWARFPETIGEPGPKCRPALVLAKGINTKNDPNFAGIQVVYGTSKLKKDRPFSRLHLIIENVLALNSFRLPQATRFDLDKIIWLPWCEEYFEPRQGSMTPIIGKLDKQYIRRLEMLMAVRATQSD